jgi:hypothetical protein
MLDYLGVGRRRQSGVGVPAMVSRRPSPIPRREAFGMQSGRNRPHHPVGAGSCPLLPAEVGATRSKTFCSKFERGCIADLVARAQPAEHTLVRRMIDFCRCVQGSRSMSGGLQKPICNNNAGDPYGWGPPPLPDGYLTLRTVRDSVWLYARRLPPAKELSARRSRSLFESER